MEARSLVINACDHAVTQEQVFIEHLLIASVYSHEGMGWWSCEPCSLQLPKFRKIRCIFQKLKCIQYKRLSLMPVISLSCALVDKCLLFYEMMVIEDGS